MKHTRKQIYTLAWLVLLSIPATLATAHRTEDEILKDLREPNSMIVVAALSRLEDDYPNSPKSIAAIKGLLNDSRPRVRRKAARVLGVIAAEVNQNEINLICGLLKSSDPNEVQDGLKSLRGVRATSAVPEILRVLKHKDENVLRDACRTLAVLGNKETIPAIEPLLNHPLPAVRKDAAVAIAALRDKP
jgi:HEAT repeat protein